MHNVNYFFSQNANLNVVKMVPLMELVTKRQATVFVVLVGMVPVAIKVGLIKMHN